MEWLDLLHPQSPVREYIAWISQSGNDALYAQKYQRLVEANAGEKPGCFITVVIRTQGKRPDMLQDVLLSLQAQLDPDFEVVILCHRAEEAAYQTVQGLIAAQPADFAARVRCVRTDEGQRGAPINLGFAYARGEYAVCLDDDDIVFDHWIQAFHQAARKEAGKILHAYVLTQPWKAWTDAQGRQCLQACGTPGDDYCVDFNTLRQQAINFCPFMGLAFPLFLYRRMHILFDEELTTTEDWDYLLRTAGVAGVADIQVPTAIYRLWDTQDVSHALYREKEWNSNYRQIDRTLRKTPVLIPIAEAARTRAIIAPTTQEYEKGRSSFLNTAHLFWADQEEFCEKDLVKTQVQYRDGSFRCAFTLPTDEAFGRQTVSRVRIDPTEEGLFALDRVKALLRYTDGSESEQTLIDCQEHNGIAFDDKVLFLAEDPMLVFGADAQKTLKQVIFTARISYECPQALKEQLAESCMDMRHSAQDLITARLYINSGKGFSEKESILCAPAYYEDRYEAVFNVAGFAQGAGDIRQIRFDPLEVGMFSLRGLQIRLTYADGAQEAVPLSDCQWHNGFETADAVAFIARDPIICLRVAAGRALKEARFTAAIHFEDLTQMELLFSQATRVSNYEVVYAQLNEARKKEAAGNHG